MAHTVCLSLNLPEVHLLTKKEFASGKLLFVLTFARIRDWAAGCMDKMKVSTRWHQINHLRHDKIFITERNPLPDFWPMSQVDDCPRVRPANNYVADLIDRCQIGPLPDHQVAMPQLE